MKPIRCLAFSDATRKEALEWYKNIPRAPRRGPYPPLKHFRTREGAEIYIAGAIENVAMMQRTATT